jgi:ferritin-like metal-binding protein YciE
MADQATGEMKLMHYLTEAYGVEKRLETALEAHIGMTTKRSYSKRLREHLSETKRHAREVEKRIRALGRGANGTGPADSGLQSTAQSVLTGAPQTVLAGAQKAAALAQGPIHALRGTGEQEKMLKNAKTEYASESEEIATYSAIEKLSEILGDKETQRVARQIRREEERMRSFLEKEIPRLTGEVARAEIPASERRKPRRSSAASRRRRTSPGTTARRPSVRGSSRRGATGKTRRPKAVAA